MKVLACILFGAIGVLGVLRGVEQLLFSSAVRDATISLAIGVLFSALFLRIWKNCLVNFSTMKDRGGRCFRGFYPGSILESKQSMVLHRPVEAAGLIGRCLEECHCRLVPVREIGR